MTQPERVAKRKHTATVTAMRDPVSSLVLTVGGRRVLGGPGWGDVCPFCTPVGSIESDSDDNDVLKLFSVVEGNALVSLCIELGLG